MEYKGYKIEPLGTFAMGEIKAKGQGFIPSDLNGFYMTYEAAKRQIDAYLGSLLKGKRNGTTESTSTG